MIFLRSANPFMVGLSCFVPGYLVIVLMALVLAQSRSVQVTRLDACSGCSGHHRKMAVLLGLYHSTPFRTQARCASLASQAVSGRAETLSGTDWRTDHQRPSPAVPCSGPAQRKTEYPQPRTHTGPTRQARPEHSTMPIAAQTSLDKFESDYPFDHVLSLAQTDLTELNFSTRVWTHRAADNMRLVLIAARYYLRV